MPRLRWCRPRGAARSDHGSVEVLVERVTQLVHHGILDAEASVNGALPGAHQARGVFGAVGFEHATGEQQAIALGAGITNRNFVDMRAATAGPGRAGPARRGYRRGPTTDVLPHRRRQAGSGRMSMSCTCVGATKRRTPLAGCGSGTGAEEYHEKPRAPRSTARTACARFRRASQKSRRSSAATSAIPTACALQSVFSHL